MGDILAGKEKIVPVIEGSMLAVLDTGSYGYVMTSNYNNRLRPAEVLLEENGGQRIIRRRDTFEDLIRNY